MIKTYYAEDLDIERLDKLIEEGEVFHVISKASVPSGDRVAGPRDAFWGIGDNNANGVRNTDSQ